MIRTDEQLRSDAIAIWQAGVDAVQADRLISENVRVVGDSLLIGDDEWPLANIRRIAVVGAGKAGAAMAAGVEQALGDRVLNTEQLIGWINVPANCVRQLRRITLHAARPAGVNEPMAEGVAGADRILEMVSTLGPNDLCLCLISGGGSALLPAPAAGVSLDDKLAVTRHLSAAGANIQQLNTVRKQLSRIKGGRLAQACRAQHLYALIISDVLGDPLDVIASGPTTANTSTPAAALEVLRQFGAREAGMAPSIFDVLERLARTGSAVATPVAPSVADAFRIPLSTQTAHAECPVTNIVIGNNALAVDGAGQEAVRRGYSPAMVAARELEGLADDVGRHLAEMSLRMRREPGPDCLITGGEPVVKLAPSAERGMGGRNQQLVLAALEHLLRREPAATERFDGMVILSAGTDGEDGPTDAAGAFIDATAIAAMRTKRLDPATFLRRNDAYHFFEPLGTLLKTGPTHTNVCDVRVVLVRR